MRPAPRHLASFLRLLAAPACLALSVALRGQGEAPGEYGAFARPPDRKLVFFPPLPPPLDMPMPGTPPVAIHPSAPGELSEHVGEYYYPQLSARLHSGSLTDAHRQRLATYRANKVALQQEIQLELTRLHDAAPAERSRALQALARRQAARLTTLDTAAEQLRVDLISHDLHWDAYRTWKLTDREARGFSPLEIAHVMLGCAFYEKGLLPAQRSFLREIAHELLQAAPSQEAAAAGQLYIFFSPSPARMIWPDGASAEALAKLAAFQSRKATLKKELYDAVHRADTRSFRFFRNPLLEVATRQVPRFAELERIAEEIRLALDPAIVAPPAPPRAPIPPLLAERAEALNRRRALLRREATLRMEAIAHRVQTEGSDLRIRFWFETDGLKFLVIPQRDNDPALGVKVRTVGLEIGAIADDYGRDLTATANAEEELRDEIAKVLGTRAPQAVENAFTAAVRAVDAAGNAGAYAAYRAAVFQPGLSPEQRRVLFDGAIEQLDLALPRGQLQPWLRSESW